MVSQEPIQATPTPFEASSSPRISFSAEFLDEKNFISITPNPEGERDREIEECEKPRNVDFEFLSGNESNNEMITADELFFEGKLIPCRQMQLSEKLNKISLKTKDGEKEGEEGEELVNKEEARVNWYVDIDDDPSPRPPKCTVLWKELLRLKKQRASSLSPSSSSSSSSSSSISLADAAAKEQSNEESDKNVKKVKRSLERTRSTTIRIRPMVNVPICTHMKSNSMIPLFPPKKGKIER